MPAVLRPLLAQVPDHLRGPVEEALAAVAPFIALDEAEVQAALAAAPTAREAATVAEGRSEALASSLAEMREAEGARWAAAIDRVATHADTYVDLDDLAEILQVADLAATDEAFDEFMRDDGVALNLGPAGGDGGETGASRLGSIACPLGSVGPVDLSGHAARLMTPGSLAASSAGLWSVDADRVAMALGDGAWLRLIDGKLVREPTGTSQAAGPGELRARRLASGEPPLLAQHAAAGLANAAAARGDDLDVRAAEVPSLFGLGAAIELDGSPGSALASTVSLVRELRKVDNVQQAAAAFLTAALEIYRVRAWLEPAPDDPGDLPAIHVGHVRWCELTGRPLCWMPVFSGGCDMVGGADRAWTADVPSGSARWEAVPPGLRLDPGWVAPLLVVPGDTNLWCLDPDGGWWSLDVEYDAIVLARRAHREGWAAALEALQRDVPDTIRDQMTLAVDVRERLDRPGPYDDVVERERVEEEAVVVHWTDDDEDGLRYLLEDLALAADWSGLWVDADENVGVLVAGGNIVVGWIEVQWRNPVPPPDRILRDPVHMMLPVERGEVTAVISEAADAGRARRQSCRYCGQSYPAGRMNAPDVCHACASAHQGFRF